VHAKVYDETIPPPGNGSRGNRPDSTPPERCLTGRIAPGRWLSLPTTKIFQAIGAAAVTRFFPPGISLGLEDLYKIDPVNEIFFEVRESPEGGYEANALGASIFTQGDDLAQVRANILEGSSVTSTIPIAQSGCGSCS
jgi:hypothetical protein